MDARPIPTIRKGPLEAIASPTLTIITGRYLPKKEETPFSEVSSCRELCLMIGCAAWSITVSDAQQASTPTHSNYNRRVQRSGARR